MNVGFHAAKNRQRQGQGQPGTGSATSSVGPAPSQTTTPPPQPAPAPTSKDGWRGKVKEMVGDGILYFFLEFFIFDIVEDFIEKIKGHFSKTAGEMAGEKLKQAMKEPARSRISDIIHVEMPEADTNNIRRWLRMGDKNRTEDEMMTLLSKLFDEKVPALTDDQMKAKIKEIDQRGHQNFKELMNRLRHDRFEQAMWRFGDTVTDIPAGILHFAEVAVDKLGPPLKDAAKWVGRGTIEVAKKIDAGAEAAAPKVDDSIYALRGWNQEREIRRRESFGHCFWAGRLGDWYRWRKLNNSRPTPPQAANPGNPNLEREYL